MAATWIRGLQELFSGAGNDVTQWIQLHEFFPGDDVTIRRIIVTWWFEMENTTGTWPTMPTVPGVLGIGTTTAVDPANPVEPASGPYTNPDVANYYWDGIRWEPNYIAPSGTSTFKDKGKIDVSVNHLIDNTLRTGVWFGAEVLDNNGSGGTFFSDWYMAMYFQILTTTQGT